MAHMDISNPVYFAITEKECYAPPAVEGANVTYTTTDYYSSAVYRCKTGFNLYSSSGFRRSTSSISIRCLSSGSWAEPPTCRRKLRFYIYLTGSHRKLHCSFFATTVSLM